MGEIFERTHPASALPWTGERLTTDVSGQVEIEHLHRYFFARAFCRGLDVLDVASGEGYGTALLAQVARSAVGVEISTEAVAHAAAVYQRPNLRYVQGDARNIPFPDNSFDAVVSFETIEHFYEHDLFIADIKRVLRPNGLLIISSPERDTYSPSIQPPNPYHVKELTRAEFSALLTTEFKHVSVYAQRPLLGSAMVLEELNAGAGPLLTFERRGADHFECSAGLPRALYLVAVASNAAPTTSKASLYIETSDLEAEFAKSRRAAEEIDRWQKMHLHLQEQAEDWRQQLIARISEVGDLQNKYAYLKEREEEWHQRQRTSDAEIAELRKQVEAADQARRSACGEIQSLVRQKANLEVDLDQKDAENQEALRRAAEFERRLEDVLHSSSWRLTGPLRGISERHPALVKHLREYLSRHPRVRWATVSTLRTTWRLVTLRRIHFGQAAAQQLVLPASAETDVNEDVVTAVPSLPTHGEPSQPPVALVQATQAATEPMRFSSRAANLWFFMGDTIDWLEAHPQVSGVARVTTELFFASLRDRAAPRMIPCSLAPTEAGLGSLSLRDTVAYLAVRTDPRLLSGFLAEVDSSATPPTTAFAPSTGDHVTFTGMVWTPNYQVLFERLAARGIRFSVLVHDIIPLERPVLVGEARHRAFEAWLTTTLSLASAIFVSGTTNKNQILRWAALAGVAVGAEIIQLPFGSTQREMLTNSSDRNVLPSQLQSGGFVLSVGTIDRRKNQALLCRLWERLEAELGPSQTPQLVLAGRDDLPIASVLGATSLLESGRLLVLEGLSDAELASLYSACLFTIFPSLSEGYGLPVAESLGHGKLCLSSDLPEIREHAGSFAWYFDPTDENSAYGMLRWAVRDPVARAAAEASIAQGHHATSWHVACRIISDTAGKITPDVAGRLRSRRMRPLQPSIPDINIPDALAAAKIWCTDQSPDVSILIVNWNSDVLTSECIRYIWANATGVRYEILIMDNGSDPATLLSLSALGTGVRLLKLGVNRYSGEANNIGAEQANGRYLCFLNNDAFGQPGWLRRLVDSMESHPDAGAVGPLFIFPEGIVQEAGATVDASGFPSRYGRGLSQADAAEVLVPKAVGYISAAALLVDRDLFVQIGGFDLAYEPAYYEDTDLCFKIRAHGREVWFEPSAKVIHLEGSAANNDPAMEARRRVVGDLNRDKFLARWKSWLENPDNPPRPQDETKRPSRSPVPAHPNDIQRVAVLYTPFRLTPGGGERFLLTAASVLAEDHRVKIATPHPYSHMRLHALGREFNIDVSQCEMITEEEFVDTPEIDLAVVMGNYIVPPLPGRAKKNLFVCQFPHPWQTSPPSYEGTNNYRAVIAYSNYARAHILAALSAHQMPLWPVEVVYPPVPQFAGDATRKRSMVLGVGRFYRGGHDKRHDLMISAFRSLSDRIGSDVELHLAGSTTPEQIGYLQELRKMAADLPVHFHVDASHETLSSLYQNAAVYWHAAGLGVDLAREPHAAEHFGISLVEAMSAQCVPIAFNAGGPREIITHGVDGFLYSSLEALADATYALLSSEAASTRETMGQAAGRRAVVFSSEVFAHRLRHVVAES